MSNMILTTRTNAVPPASGGGSDTQLVSLTNCTASPILAGDRVWVKHCNGLTAYAVSLPYVDANVDNELASNFDGSVIGLCATNVTSYVHKGSMVWGTNSATYTDSGTSYQYYYDIFQQGEGLKGVYDTAGGLADIYNARYVSASNMPFSWVNLPKYNNTNPTAGNNNMDYLCYDNQGIVAYDKETNTIDTSLVWSFVPTETMGRILFTPYHDDYFFVTYVTYDNDIMWNVLSHTIKLIKLNAAAESYTDLGEYTVNSSGAWPTYGVGHSTWAYSSFPAGSRWHYIGGNYFIATNRSSNLPPIYIIKVDEDLNVIDYSYSLPGITDKLFYLDSSEGASAYEPSVIINRANNLIFGALRRDHNDFTTGGRLDVSTYCFKYNPTTNDFTVITVDWTNAAWWYKSLDNNITANVSLYNFAIYGNCEKFGISLASSDSYVSIHPTYFFGYIKDIHGYAAMPYPVGAPNGQFVEAIATTDIQPNGTGSAYILAQQS